jgi:hypothetical protein
MHERESQSTARGEAMKPALNGAICVWCRNRQQEVCVELCQTEGRYRYLEPAPLETWELPPELPPFRELLDLPAVERLALIYLAAVYERREQERNL